MFHTIPGRFALGRIFASTGASERLAPGEIHLALWRHAQGDWGELSAEDAALNDEAVTRGTRILSAYTSGGERFWIVTEADRTATTVLLPSEY